MTIYTPDSPYLAEFDGTLRAIIVADNYQNSVPIEIDLIIDTVAPVRIFPSGQQALTEPSFGLFKRKSEWVTMTDDIYLWTPTPNTAIFYAETTLTSHAAPTDTACPVGVCPLATWTCFSGCAGGSTKNFTRSYSVDLFAKATKVGYTDSAMTQEWFEVQVSKPVAWPKYETNLEWTGARKTAPAPTMDPAYTTDTTGDTEADASKTESLRVSLLSEGATQPYVCDDLFIGGTDATSTNADGTAITDPSDGSDCFDRYYLDSVQVFIATQTPTELDGVTISECPDELVSQTAVCPKSPGIDACPADAPAAECTCGTNSVGVTICGIPYCPPGAACPLREKTISYQLGETGETSPYRSYTDATAPKLWESNRVAVKANKNGLTESDTLFTWFRVKFQMPTIIDDPDQIDVGYEQERRNYGSEITLVTDVTVNADSTSTTPYQVGGVDYVDGDTSVCMGKTRQECTTGSARHGVMYYSQTDVTDLTCDCRQAKGHLNGYGARPDTNTASCNWQVYDDTAKPTLTSSSNFCTQIVAIDGVSVNSDVAYRRYWLKTPTTTFDETNDPIYVSQMNVKLSTMGGSTNAEPTEGCAATTPGTDDAACAAITGGACETLVTPSDDEASCLALGDCAYTAEVAVFPGYVPEACVTVNANPQSVTAYNARNARCKAAGACTYSAARSIWYVLANPGSDWWTTTEATTGADGVVSTAPVRQAPKACPHWACGAACPQRQDQCPPAEFEADGTRTLVSLNAASSNGGLSPTDTRDVYSQGPISYYDLIATGKYDQATGTLDADLRTNQAVQLYDPAAGITLTENKVIFAFSTDDNWAISDVAARDYDLRVADPLWSFSTLDGSGTTTVPAHIDQAAQEGITKYEVTATTSTTGSRMHICRKKRCPKAIQTSIDTSMRNLDTDCSTCGGCTPIAGFKAEVAGHNEYQGVAYIADDGTSTNDYGQGEVYNDFLESGCNMYFFEKYPKAATFYASCEMGAPMDVASSSIAMGDWMPMDVAAQGSYWFTTDVLDCQWKTQAGDTSTVAGQAADAYVPATWDTTHYANSWMPMSLDFNSALLSYASKRNVRPSFYRGQAATNANRDTVVGATDRDEVDDWDTSYTEYFVKAAAVGMTAASGTTADMITVSSNGDIAASCPLGQPCVDFSQDVTLTSSTPGARIHYKFFPDYPRENTLQMIPVVGNPDNWNVACGGNTVQPVATLIAGATDQQTCFQACIAASESNANVRFCQWTTECNYLDTCETPTAHSGIDATMARTGSIDWDTIRSSLPDGEGRKDTLTGFSVTDEAPTDYGCPAGATNCGYAASPMASDSSATARKFSADPLTTTDLNLPHSGWTKTNGFEQLDASASLQGNAWSHCSSDNVVDLVYDATNPTAPGADPLQQTDNNITIVDSTTDTVGSTCKLHLKRSGRLFVYATRVSNDADSGTSTIPVTGAADNDIGGLQVPSDVTWSDFELKNPDLTYELFASTCGTTGQNDYCSPSINGDGRVLDSIVGNSYMYACAGSRVQNTPPLRASQSNSNGAVVCDQDTDTRIHYTIAQDEIAPVPRSTCEADMEALDYSAVVESSSCPDQNGIRNQEKTRVWRGSITDDSVENRGTQLRSLPSTRFHSVKAKAVKKFSADSKTLSLTFPAATSLCQSLNCEVKVRLAQTAGGASTAIVMTKVTNIAAAGGGEIPGLNDAFLNNIMSSSAGQSWYTNTYTWLRAFAYNEAVCTNQNCETMMPVPAIPDFQNAGTAATYNAFVVDIDFPKAASGVGMVPILQMRLNWPQTNRADPPKGCAAFSITARQYTGRTLSTQPAGAIPTGTSPSTRADAAAVPLEQEEADYTPLKVVGGFVKTCFPATCADPVTCTQACTDIEAFAQSGSNLFNRLSCAASGCDLETHTTQNVDPYRSGLDVFQLYNAPIVDGLRYTCQKQAGERAITQGGSAYSM